MWHTCNTQVKQNIYRDRSRVVELLLQLENKQQIMQNNAEIDSTHAHYLLYIGSLCNIAFPMARFTCTITSVTHENLNALQ